MLHFVIQFQIFFFLESFRRGFDVKIISESNSLVPDAKKIQTHEPSLQTEQLYDMRHRWYGPLVAFFIWLQFFFSFSHSSGVRWLPASWGPPSAGVGAVVGAFQFFFPPTLFCSRVRCTIFWVVATISIWRPLRPSGYPPHRVCGAVGPSPGLLSSTFLFWFHFPVLVLLGKSGWPPTKASHLRLVATVHMLLLAFCFVLFVFFSKPLISMGEMFVFSVEIFGGIHGSISPIRLGLGEVGASRQSGPLESVLCTSLAFPHFSFDFSGF